MPKIIYLIGFMCAGKTTIGTLLAEKISYEFLDTDSYIERLESKKIDDIFALKGEPYFRDLEIKALRELSKENRVISTGGGLGANDKALEFMKEKGLVVYLQIDFDTFYQRCKNLSNRPILKKSYEELKKIFEERKNTYQKANIILDAHKEPPKIVEELISLWKTN